MNANEHTSTVTPPAEAARAFAAAIDAAVTGLERDVPDGLAPLHQALAARIRHALSRLLACVEQLAVDELLVAGSTGQRRPHPLLKTEQELRKEISEGLKELTFRVEQEALLLQANALTRGERSAAAERGEG